MVGETNLQRMIKKMKLAIAMTVAATLFASGASAFDPDDLQKLKDTNECRICDLTNANLSGAIMQGAILCNTTMPDGSVIYSGC